jgi:phytoene dehydrogenase-like protein
VADTEYDAVVVGSGPNGLVAAATLGAEGLRVLVLEAEDTVGGGARSAELTLPGFVHDTCSTVWALGLASKAMRELPLEDHGVDWVHPEIPVAQPLDGGRSALLHRSVDRTAEGLGADGNSYRRLIGPLVGSGFSLVDGLLSPLQLPRHPLKLARYGIPGIRSARSLGRRRFETEEARALLGGLSAHSILSLRAPITAGYGLMLGVAAHLVGYPFVRGGSQQATEALRSIIEGQGGEVVAGTRVTSLDDVPPARAVLLDVSARNAAAIGGDRFSARYRKALTRFRYGAGVHKVDWALDGPVPWADPDVARAGTVHLGGTLEEMVAAEGEVADGAHPERPFVLLCQASGFDPSRAPEGQHALWAYCHVPNGSTVDMTDRIEAQIERFAPGFRDRILARHVMGTAEVEARNANYVGGDINAGAADLRQFVRRPTIGFDPWRTPAKGVYLCSSSTPPGGGVHGMCGWHAAKSALKHEFSSH